MRRQIPLVLTTILLAATTTLAAQTRQRLATARPMTILAPAASVSFTSLGGAAPLAGTMISALAEHVKVSSTGIGGAAGELMMTARVSGAGVPGSLLTVQSAAPLPAATYGVEVAFLHGRAGVVRFVDATTGAVITTCTLNAAGWGDVQRCGAQLAVNGHLRVTVDVSSGYQVFPSEITIAQYR